MCDEDERSKVYLLLPGRVPWGLEVARPNARKMNKRTSQVNSLEKGPHEGRVAAVDGAQPRQRGDARHKMMPANALCCSFERATAIHSAECVPPLEVSCSTGLQRPRWRWATWRWWDALCPSLPAMTKGGRAVVRSQGVRWQRSNPHRSLPPQMLQLPGA